MSMNAHLAYSPKGKVPIFIEIRQTSTGESQAIQKARGNKRKVAVYLDFVSNPEHRRLWNA
jgi:hypothetical protein